MAKVVFKLGDDISTDIIYPGRFMATVLPTETPQYAFADHAEFNEKLKRKEIAPGSVILAGDNFGCGSSREQAASCLKGHDLTIVAKGFARIFLQNAINLGFKTIICPEIEANEGDDLEILEIIGDQNPMIDRPGSDRGQDQDERDRDAHGKRRFDLFRHAEKGADAQEVVKDEIIDQDRTDENEKKVHLALLLRTRRSIW